MLDTLAAYPAMLRSGVLVALSYRGRLVLWFVSGLFPLLLMAVWLTVVQGTGPVVGWDTGDFVSYYLAAAVLFQLTNPGLSWSWDNDLRSGDLSARLLRPVAPVHHYVTQEAGTALVTVLLLLPVVTVLALALPVVHYPLTPVRVVGVLLAVLIAFVLGLAMASVFALFGFWTTQTGNVYMLWWGLGSFVSGWIAPLDLMPGWLSTTALVLPFRSVIGFPLELLLGRLDRGETAYGFAVGLAWLGFFVLLYHALWRRGLRRYQAVGG